MHCPSCGVALDGAAATCRSCGHELATLVGPPADAPKEPGNRFVPGAIVEGRYRIAGLLGRGGMGEVYRADDLKLGQPVALKFLPLLVEAQPAVLARFLDEVRTARRVSHPNVCRVHDLGEAAGHHFLSMEYIDGEDLASLLRRIGRLPEDKALEIARQICAGLAAAHDAHVLHRDLKPANVMLDGRGRVRITDFGLAGLTGSFAADEVLAGTPAYMAPEQLRGERVDERSDIYALGLVLYEIFAGRPAFATATSLAELVRGRQNATPIPPGQLVRSLDPAIERVLLRCLESDPALRPRSVAQVLAMLPGGDPLAAAMAAGETPSPGVVATAGEAGTLSTRTATLCLLGVVAALLALAAFAPRATVAGQIRPTKPTAVLEERAKALAAATAPPNRPDVVGDDAFGFRYDEAFLQWLRESDEPEEGPVEPVALQFWYRSSPRPLVPDGFLTLDNPVANQQGMVSIRLDTRGMLLSLERRPPEFADAASTVPTPVDWNPLLSAAGLDPTDLVATTPLRLPPSFASERRAWLRNTPGATPLRIEAASFEGYPIAFEVLGPWQLPELSPDRTTLSTSVGRTIVVGLWYGLLVIAILLARRNLKLGRADLVGAKRLVAVLAAAEFLGWILLAHFPASPVALLDFVVDDVVTTVGLSSMILFVLYLSVEPFLRRHAPHRIVAWSRLLEGRWRDPLVARDVLIGVLVGTAMAALAFAGAVARDNELPIDSYDVIFLGPSAIVGQLMLSLPVAFALGMLLFFQLVARRTGERAAAAIYFSLSLLLHALFLGSSLPLLALFAVIAALTTFNLVRFGLMSMIVQQLVYLACLHGPVTSDLGVSYVASSWTLIVIVLGLAGYGFWGARSGAELSPSAWLIDD